MLKLKVTSPWRGRDRVIPVGEYFVPSEIKLLDAKCCVADKAGRLVKVSPSPLRPGERREDGEGAVTRSTFPSTKTPAPENKSRGPAPKAKS